MVVLSTDGRDDDDHAHGDPSMMKVPSKKVHYFQFFAQKTRCSLFVRDVTFNCLSAPKAFMNTSILPTTTAASRADYLTNNEAAGSDCASKISNSPSLGVNFSVELTQFLISLDHSFQSIKQNQSGLQVIQAVTF